MTLIGKRRMPLCVLCVHLLTFERLFFLLLFPTADLRRLTLELDSDDTDHDDASAAPAATANDDDADAESLLTLLDGL